MKLFSTPDLPKQQTADERDIFYAYRLLLGREPDPIGYKHFLEMVKRTPLSATDLAAIFVGSNEFTRRNPHSNHPIEVAMDGYSMFVRQNDRDIGAWIIKNRLWESHVTQVVRELLRSGHTFVDVGANIGYFAALAAHLVGSSGKVVAVEPMDKNVQLIRATRWRNRFDQLKIFPNAASDDAALLPMTTGPATSNGVVVQDVLGDDPPMLFAQAVRLDDVLCDLSRMDLVKFDIEGHEFKAWQGFERTIAQHRPLILTEFHPKCMRENSGIDPAAYLQLLFEYGSRIDVLHDDGSRVACPTAESIIVEWEAADRRLKSEGGAHLDLFVEPRA